LEPAPVIETAPPQAVEPVEAIPEPQPAEDDMGRALMIFLAVNLALVFIGFNVFFILRMKKQTQKK
jgi:hypothetical protein